MNDLEKIMEQLDRVEKRLRHVLDHVYRVEDDVKHIRYPTQAFGGAMHYGPEDRVHVPSQADPKEVP